jgi:hypothetical protein
VSVAAAFALLALLVSFALTLRHAQRALGLGRAAIELAALAGLIVVVWRLQPGAPRAGAVTMALMAVGWAALALCAMALGGRVWWVSPLGRAAATALLAGAVQIGLEPAALRLGLWSRPLPGAFLGASVTDALATALLVLAWVVAAELQRPSRGVRALLRPGLVLAALAVIVGLHAASSALRAEGAMGLRPAWVVWAALVGIPGVLALTGRAAVLPDTLAGQLAAVHGSAPALAVALPLLAVAGAAQDPAASIAALGAALPALAMLPARPPLDGWRTRAFARLGHVQDFVHVLMKPRNGQPWTPEDRAFLRAGARTLARWAPGFLLFLLPGGLVLLSLYAWLLDRRRGRVVDDPAQQRRLTDAEALSERAS